MEFCCTAPVLLLRTLTAARNPWCNCSPMTNRKQMTQVTQDDVDEGYRKYVNESYTAGKSEGVPDPSHKSIKCTRQAERKHSKGSRGFQKIAGGLVTAHATLAGRVPPRLATPDAGVALQRQAAPSTL